MAPRFCPCAPLIAILQNTSIRMGRSAATVAARDRSFVMFQYGTPERVLSGNKSLEV